MPETKQQRLKAKIDALPPALVDEVDDFVDFVAAKRSAPSEEAGPGVPASKQAHRFEAEEVEERTLKQDWAGGLSHLKDEYTAVELKGKALEWWAEAAQE